MYTFWLKADPEIRCKLWCFSFIPWEYLTSPDRWLFKNELASSSPRVPSHGHDGTSVGPVLGSHRNPECPKIKKLKPEHGILILGLLWLTGSWIQSRADGWRHYKCLRQVHAFEYWTVWTELRLPGWHLILLPLLAFHSTTWHGFASD